MRYYKPISFALMFLILAVLALLLAVSIPAASAQNDDYSYSYIKEAVKEYLDKEKGPKSICPKTLMKDNCMTCHIKDWRTKEVRWDADLEYPYGLKFYRVGKEAPSLAYYQLTTVSSDAFKGVIDYLNLHNIHHLIVDVQCWGGGAMEMWRMVGHMRQWKAEGNLIETQVNGAAISAGFVIFTSGTKGHRLVNPSAELMWHEAQMLEWPEITTPTDTEKKAAIYRHFQDNCHIYLSTVCNLTKEEIDKKVRDLEWWMNGRDALKYGFADGLVGK